MHLLVPKAAQWERQALSKSQGQIKGTNYESYSNERHLPVRVSTPQSLFPHPGLCGFTRHCLLPGAHFLPGQKPAGRRALKGVKKGSVRTAGVSLAIYRSAGRERSGNRKEGRTSKGGRNTEMQRETSERNKEELRQTRGERRGQGRGVGRHLVLHGGKMVDLTRTSLATVTTSTSHLPLTRASTSSSVYPWVCHLIISCFQQESNSGLHQTHSARYI